MFVLKIYNYYTFSFMLKFEILKVENGLRQKLDGGHVSSIIGGQMKWRGGGGRDMFEWQNRK